MGGIDGRGHVGAGWVGAKAVGRHRTEAAALTPSLSQDQDSN